jgi:hypothetical protein
VPGQAVNAAFPFGSHESQLRWWRQAAGRSGRGEERVSKVVRSQEAVDIGAEDAPITAYGAVRPSLPRSMSANGAAFSE